MQIDKRNRAELKQYFVKNAIPTESNFAELIDAMMSQKDDGIAKLPNDPLSIEASGDDTSQKKAIHFYKSFGDADPTWVLSLNPRSNPADAATARPGLSIGDSTGKSRLFVDRATGRLGVGTIDPRKTLHVQGLTTGPFMNDANDRPAIAVTGNYPEIALFSNVNNTNHGPAIRMGSYTDAAATTFKHWVIGTSGRNSAFLDIGFSDKSDPNPHAGIRGYNGKTVMTLEESGNVGIGTLDPATDLTIRRDVSAGLGPVLTLTNGLGSAGAGAAIDFNGYNVGANAPTVRLQSLDDGNFSSHLTISTKVPGAANTALKERLRITSDGWVGIGTGGTPDFAVHARIATGGWQARFENPTSNSSVYLSHGGGYGMHIRTDTAATGNYLLQLYNASQGGSLFFVATSGDVSMAKSLNVSGQINAPAGLNFEGAVAHIEKDGAIYRNTDGQCYITVDDHLYIRDAGAASWASHFETNSGSLDLRGHLSGGETSTGWVLGRGAWGPDNWLRITTPALNKYHDLAIESLWSAGLKRFDLAEVTSVCADDRLEQGDVVVIDREDGTRVRRSARAHDPGVYGIVSSYHQAAMVIGGFGGPEEMMHATDKRPIALVGRVKVKVSTENGPIAVGDLLTTSSTPGHAMRCTDPGKHPGAIAGKALEAFTAETGIITALVALQ